MSIFLGLLGIGIGLLISIKHEWFLNNVGRIAAVEKYMRLFGGSRLFYQLLGVLLIILSTLYMTGLLQKLLTGLAGKVFGLE